MRPPGHHSGPEGVVAASHQKNDEGSHGFCLINNVALAASYALNIHREKVIIEEKKGETQNLPQCCANLGLSRVVDVSYIYIYKNVRVSFRLESRLQRLPYWTLMYIMATEHRHVSLPRFRGSECHLLPLVVANLVSKFRFGSHGMISKIGPTCFLRRFKAMAAGLLVTMRASFILEQVKRRPSHTHTLLILTPTTHCDEKRGDDCLPVSGAGSSQDSYLNSDVAKFAVDTREHRASKEGPRVINVGIPGPGRQRKLWRRAWRDVIFPELHRFEPDLIIISAGFDAHARDEVCFKNYWLLPSRIISVHGADTF